MAVDLQEEPSPELKSPVEVEPSQTARGIAEELNVCHAAIVVDFDAQCKIDKKFSLLEVCSSLLFRNKKALFWIKSLLVKKSVSCTIIGNILDCG